MNDNKPFGELSVGMKMSINDLNAIYGDYKHITIDPVAYGTLGMGMSFFNKSILLNQMMGENGGSFVVVDPKSSPFTFGTLGLGSMLRSFTKDEFVLDYVPDYALLKEEAERIRAWDHYGKASEQEIGEMLISGWKRKSEFTAALELRAVGTLEPGA